MCVSTQAGCAMACGFCATGQAGFERQLTRGRDRRAGRAGPPAGARARRAPAGVQRRVHGHGRADGQLRPHLGRGRAPPRRHRPLGPPPHVSTVGIVPGIRRLADEALPVNLAVSLHAANDELRDELVPINRRYPLAAPGRGLRALPRGQEPAAVVRVGADRRRQRPRHRRRRAGRLRPAARGPTSTSSRSTRRPATRPAGTPPERVRAFRDRLRVARRQRHRPPEPRHRHRRRLRPAPRRPRSAEPRWRSADRDADG